MKKKILRYLSVFLAVLVLGPAATYAAESTFHGQFRINSYLQNSSDDNIFGKGDDVQASRLRWRPTWDVKFDNGVAMHMQLNIGHINSNIFNARYTLNGNDTDSGGDPAVALRHATITGPLPTGGTALGEWSITAGLTPLSDRFDDTLFSADWDWNPLAFTLNGTLTNGVAVRISHAVVDENAENGHPADDVDQWIVDLDKDTSIGKVGVSYYAINDNTGGGNSRIGGSTKANEHYVGVRYARSFDLGPTPLDFNLFYVYNWGTRKFDASGTNPTERDNKGSLVKAQFKAPVGPARVGLMALYATGDRGFQDEEQDSSNAFLSPETVVGTTGYWGYTGKLNVQGPTDTGIDCQAVNVDGADYCSGSNAGSGITTVQFNLSLPIVKDKLDGYAAVGYFTANQVPTTQSKYYGTDVYVQAKYMFGHGLNAELGVDYVALGKGHPNDIIKDESRSMVLLFSRFQLEY